MSVSEWSLPLSRGGVKTTVGEYSLSAVGPGPRATKHWQLAREAGLKTVAKVQVNNTWELSAVPYLPVMDLVAEHASNLASAGVDGTMLSWTLGGYPSPNLEVARRLSAKEPLSNPRGLTDRRQSRSAPGGGEATSQPTPSKEQVLDDLARERFGPAGAAHARRAWTLFSDALREYPYSGQVIYDCPVQLGPANLLYPEPTGYPATMVGFPYDDAKHWASPYGPEILAVQFEKVAAGWDRGLAEFSQAAANAPPAQAAAAKADLRLARAAGLHFKSVANQTRFVTARDALLARPAPAGEDRRRHVEQIRRIATEEMELARQLFRLARRIRGSASRRRTIITTSRRT